MKVLSIGSVNYSQNGHTKTNFKEAEKNQQPVAQPVVYENPISRKTERNLAVLGAIGGSAVVGAIAGGLVSCIPAVKGLKIPVLSGVGAAVVTLALTLPSKLYHTAINAFAREKEMDIFSRDKALKSNLTEEVHKEVMDPNVSLDKKLDDNLKLQTANRAVAMFFNTMNSAQ